MVFLSMLTGRTTLRRGCSLNHEKATSPRYGDPFPAKYFIGEDQMVLARSQPLNRIPFETLRIAPYNRS
jgi:hypothetical protein